MSLFQAVFSELQVSSPLDTSPSSFSPSFYAGNLLEPTVIATAPSRSSLVFIDPGVDAYQSLLAGVSPGTTVYVLDPLQDAVAQITNTLLGRTGVDSIHIVSHGQSGSLQLGNGFLNLATLPEYASQIQSWSAALTDDADILLYGCDVASGELGQAFVSILSQLTGADIAASNDLTGSSSQGGDWTLEFNTGNIETTAIASSMFGSVLATFNIAAGDVNGLIAAITTSNSNGQADTINLTAGSTYTLTTVNNNTSGSTGLPAILGDGGNSLTINGNGATITRANGTPNFRIMALATGNANLILDNLTISNGSILDGSQYGAAIFGDFGGSYTLTLRNSTLTGNTSGFWGGAIYTNTSGTINIINSAITNNTSNGSPGGGINHNGGTLNITNSTISNNRTLSFGGGIFVETGTANIVNSTISGNSANVDGGGIGSQGILNLINTTITNNTADNDNNGSGGGGGVYIVGGTANVRNTIIAGNFDTPNNAGGGVTSPDVFGTFVNQGNNLIGRNNGSNFVAGGLIGTIAAPVSPGLSTLGNNGGRNQTHALLTGSLAINAGSNASIATDTFDIDGDTITNEPIPFDQRGTSFARIQGGTVDIGAFELLNDLPPVLNVSGTADYTENATPGVVAGGLTITDSDGGNIAGARVAITTNFAAAEDQLGISGQAGNSGTVLGLNWNYNSTTGVLAITGTGTAATYQDALRLVTYSNLSDTPSTAARNLQFSLGSSLANPTNGHFYEFVSDPNISWTAAQAAAAGRNYFGLQGYLVTITSASEQAFVQDKLQGYGWMGANDVATEGNWRWVTGPEGLANGGTGTPFWLGDGTSGGPVNGQYSNWAVIAPNWTANEPNDALTGEDYAHFINGGRWNDYANTTPVQGYVVEYGGMPTDPVLQTTSNITVNVTSVNDIPAIGGTTGTLSYTEGQVATAIASGLTITDVDSTTITGATVQITGNYANGQDILAFTNQLGITAGPFNATTGTLTLTGTTTLASYQAALRSITYQNTSNNPSALPRTVTFTVNDGGATNNLGTATRNITVTSTNTAPALTITAGTANYNEGQAATPIDAGLTLTDVDSTNITGATVQITGNYASGQDVLAFTDQLGITGAFNATTGTLTLTGTTTVANYQAALRAITYQNTSNNPNTANRTVTFTVNDGGVSNNNGTATRGIVVTSIDAPSVLTIAGTATPTFTEGGSAVVLAPTLTVTDLDGMNGARVTIANLQAGDSLGIQGQPGSNGTINGLNWSYDANTGILTLSGNATAAVYESTLRLVTYSNANGAVNATARNIQFSLGATLSNPDNGHFYEFVTAAGIDWTEAQTVAANRRLFGLQGYLATITSASEQAFVQTKLQGLGWMGGSDAATEGDWRWVTGPEGLANGGAGTPFWLGTGTGGSPVGGQYNNWDTVEPNDFGTGEDYAHFLNGGKWNDYANTTFVQGYVVEYGGMPGDPALQTTGNITLNISAVNDAPVLDTSGSPTLISINEDDITTTGTLISTLLSSLGGTGITDLDGGSALRGIAITTVNNTNGSWEFSINGGTTWTAIGTLTETNARLLADNPNTRIRFIPAPNYFGSIANAISFRAWDQTIGTNGGTANTSGTNSGGTTAFSTAIETAGITVNPVDDTEFLVTNTADSGNGSLRQAILLANAEAGAETIRFVGNTFTDATADIITLTGELVITDSVTIVGTGADRLTFTSNAGEPARIFNVNGPAVLNLSDLAIANGNAGNANGGGILNTGGTVSLQRTRLTGNTATSGGAIYNAAGGTVNITNSTIDGNTATTSGAGLANFGTLNLLNVTISGNSSANGSGGGLYNAGAGIASLNFVTIANNTATTGGGINNAAGTVNLRNTLIATNIATNSPDVFGNFTSNGNNLVSRIDGSTGVNQASDIVGTSAAPINAGIAALRNVGGTTSTHRLLPGSPAINAGNNTGAPATDQRGALRTISGRSDIGAFEYSPQPDFNQDGNLDLLWHNSANGQITTWQMNGFSFSTFYLQPANIPAPWQIVGNADFDGDGDPDLVWRNSATGQTTIWEMNGFMYSTFRVLANAPADTNWSIAGLADFNGDGSPDIVWRNEQAGLTSLWRMNGFSYSTFSLLPNVDHNWRLERVADFNRDGNPDLIWHNTVNGTVTLWRMNGFSYSTFSVIGNVDANWYVEGAADFNGDGSTDIVWRNRQTGVNAIWQMNGFSYSTFSALPTIDPSWSVERVADYNNDGSPDLLWYNRSTGKATMWRMNGLSFSTFTTLPDQSPSTWGIFIDS